MHTSTLICKEAEWVLDELTNPILLDAYSPPAWMQTHRRVVFDCGELELTFTYVRITGEWLRVRLGAGVDKLLQIARRTVVNSPHLHAEILKRGVLDPELDDDVISEMLPEMREALVRAITGVYDAP